MGYDVTLTEEDVKLRFITPALVHAGWDTNHIFAEKYYTAGRIMVQGNMKHRRRGKKMDYLLMDSDNYPIAVVEAKDNSHQPASGLQQAIEYAVDNDLHFAYSSNGKAFVEHDFWTGEERTLDMSEFPTPEELRRREVCGKKLSQEELDLIDVPYYTDSKFKSPRYYQRIAINRTIEAIAKGQKRILLVMATGTGKTYTAFQIMHRLYKSKKVKKILYLADRNILIDQTMKQDFQPFNKIMTKVQGKKPESGYAIYMSLYGQWVNNKDEYISEVGHPYEAYKPDFFDLIIVDECHRSSINEDKEWHKILEYFSDAVQIGMTATPKAVEGANNIEYFGKPVYTYSLKQGIDDGFLAPFKVTSCNLDIDTVGYFTEEEETDLNGLPIDKRFFDRKTFGREITIMSRQKAVAKRITQMMQVIGRMTKTIVFCPDQEEALIMRNLLISLNKDMVKKNPNYIVRITSDETGHEQMLDNFIDPYEKYPVIVTTSDLLTTGVDCKTCGHIVIDKEVGSVTVFKQMIGRGTRILEEMGKMSFEILDFREATVLFMDPAFDGPAESQQTLEQRVKEGSETTKDSPKPTTTVTVTGEKRVKYHVEGHDVDVSLEMVQHLDDNGRILKTESITDFTRRMIQNRYPTLESFRGAWMKADQKQAILDELKGDAVIIENFRNLYPQYAECDEFDIICHIAYNQKPLTRKERMAGVRKRNFYAKYGEKARQVIEALIDKYGEVGITDIESKEILQLDPFTKIAARPRIIKGVFKGIADYNLAIKELEEQIYMQA